MFPKSHVHLKHWVLVQKSWGQIWAKESYGGFYTNWGVWKKVKFDFATENLTKVALNHC